MAYIFTEDKEPEKPERILAPFRCTNCDPPFFYSISIDRYSDGHYIYRSDARCPQCQGYGLKTTKKEIEEIRGNPVSLKKVREELKAEIDSLRAELNSRTNTKSTEDILAQARKEWQKDIKDGIKKALK